MYIEIDFNSEEAIYIQLRNQIIMGIATSEIQEGESLPSVRQLAETVGINMHTVNKAYSVLKQEAEALFNDLGLSMSSAINMFLRSAVMHDGIPFEIRRQIPNAETKAALDEYEEMKKHPDRYKRYESVDEMLDEEGTDHA